jgi:hypothetical protein
MTNRYEPVKLTPAKRKELGLTELTFRPPHWMVPFWAPVSRTEIQLFGLVHSVDGSPLLAYMCYHDPAAPQRIFRGDLCLLVRYISVDETTVMPVVGIDPRTDSHRYLLQVRASLGAYPPGRSPLRLIQHACDLLDAGLADTPRSAVFIALQNHEQIREMDWAGFKRQLLRIVGDDEEVNDPELAAHLPENFDAQVESLGVSFSDYERGAWLAVLTTFLDASRQNAGYDNDA